MSRPRTRHRRSITASSLHDPAIPSHARRARSSHREPSHRRHHSTHRPRLHQGAAVAAAAAAAGGSGSDTGAGAGAAGPRRGASSRTGGGGGGGRSGLAGALENGAHRSRRHNAHTAAASAAAMGAAAADSMSATVRTAPIGAYSHQLPMQQHLQEPATTLMAAYLHQANAHARDNGHAHSHVGSPLSVHTQPLPRHHPQPYPVNGSAVPQDLLHPAMFQTFSQHPGSTSPYPHSRQPYVHSHGTTHAHSTTHLSPSHSPIPSPSRSPFPEPPMSSSSQLNAKALRDHTRRYREGENSAPASSRRALYTGGYVGSGHHAAHSAHHGLVPVQQPHHDGGHGRRRSQDLTNFDVPVEGTSPQIDDPKLSKFLHRIKLTRYTQTFLEEGYDMWESFCVLTPADLEAMGVLRGHRALIMKRLEEEKEAEAAEDAAKTRSTSPHQPPPPAATQVTAPPSSILETDARSVASCGTAPESVTSLASSHTHQHQVPQAQVSPRRTDVPPPPYHDDNTTDTDGSEGDSPHGITKRKPNRQGNSFARLPVTTELGRSTSVPPTRRRGASQNGSAEVRSSAGLLIPFPSLPLVSGGGVSGAGNGEGLAPSDSITDDARHLHAAAAAASTAPHSPASVASSRSHARSAARSFASSHVAAAAASVRSHKSVHSHHSQRLGGPANYMSPAPSLGRQSHYVGNPSMASDGAPPSFERSPSEDSRQSYGGSSTSRSHASNALMSTSTTTHHSSRSSQLAHQRAPASPVLGIANPFVKNGSEFSFPRSSHHSGGHGSDGGFYMSPQHAHERALYRPIVATSSASSRTQIDNELSKTSTGKASSKSDPFPRALSSPTSYHSSQRSTFSNHTGHGEEASHPGFSRGTSHSSYISHSRESAAPSSTYSVPREDVPPQPNFQPRVSLTHSYQSDSTDNQQNFIPPTRRSRSLQAQVSSSSIRSGSPSLASVAPPHLRPTMVLDGFHVGPGGVPSSSPLVQSSYSPTSYTSEHRDRATSSVASQSDVSHSETREFSRLPSVVGNHETPISQTPEPPSEDDKSTSSKHRWSHDLSSLALADGKTPKGVVYLSPMFRASSASLSLNEGQESLNQQALTVDSSPPVETPTPRADPGEDALLPPPPAPPGADEETPRSAPTPTPLSDVSTHPQSVEGAPNASDKDPQEGLPDGMPADQPQELRSLSELAAELEADSDSDEERRADSDNEVATGASQRRRRLPPFLRKRSLSHSDSMSLLTDIDADGGYSSCDDSVYSFLPSSLGSSFSRLSSFSTHRDSLFSRADSRSRQGSILSSHLDSLVGTPGSAVPIARSPDFGRPGGVLTARPYQARGGLPPRRPSRKIARGGKPLNGKRKPAGKLKKENSVVDIRDVLQPGAIRSPPPKKPVLDKPKSSITSSAASSREDSAPNLLRPKTEPVKLGGVERLDTSPSPSVSPRGSEQREVSFLDYIGNIPSLEKKENVPQEAEKSADKPKKPVPPKGRTLRRSTGKRDLRKALPQRAKTSLVADGESRAAPDSYSCESCDFKADFATVRKHIQQSGHTGLPVPSSPTNDMAAKHARDGSVSSDIASRHGASVSFTCIGGNGGSVPRPVELPATASTTPDSPSSSSQHTPSQRSRLTSFLSGAKGAGRDKRGRSPRSRSRVRSKSPVGRKEKENSRSSGAGAGGASSGGSGGSIGSETSASRSTLPRARTSDFGSRIKRKLGLGTNRKNSPAPLSRPIDALASSPRTPYVPDQPEYASDFDNGNSGSSRNSSSRSLSTSEYGGRPARSASNVAIVPSMSMTVPPGVPADRDGGGNPLHAHTVPAPRSSRGAGVTYQQHGYHSSSGTNPLHSPSSNSMASASSASASASSLQHEDQPGAAPSAGARRQPRVSAPSSPFPSLQQLQMQHSPHDVRKSAPPSSTGDRAPAPHQQQQKQQQQFSQAPFGIHVPVPQAQVPGQHPFPMYYSYGTSPSLAYQQQPQALSHFDLNQGGGMPMMTSPQSSSRGSNPNPNAHFNMQGPIVLSPHDVFAAAQLQLTQMFNNSQAMQKNAHLQGQAAAVAAADVEQPGASSNSGVAPTSSGGEGEKRSRAAANSVSSAP